MWKKRRDRQTDRQTDTDKQTDGKTNTIFTDDEAALICQMEYYNI